MDSREQAPEVFIQQLEQTTSFIPNPTDALKCTRNITLPGSGHLDVATGYKAELLESYNIEPWRGTKVQWRILRRTKDDIRKAMKWRRQTRKRDKRNHTTLACTCQHIQIDADTIEIMAQECATHSLDTTTLVMMNQMDDHDIDEGRQLIQDIPGDLPRSEQPLEFNEEKTARILEIQKHQDLQVIKTRVKGEIDDPEPHTGTVLAEHLKIYYRNKDAFTVSSKNVLFRRWFQKDRDVRCIPLIDNDAIKKLVVMLHGPGQ
jgi:hypothetical protein